MTPLFLYLAYGRSPATVRELRYSFQTLLPEIGGDASRVVIYTDRPQAYADLGANLVDATDILRAAFACEYRHRIKPMVLADALRRFAQPCALLDTDSFIRPGFTQAIAGALSEGAAMNFLVRRDPYSDFAPFETDLPHLRRYRLDRNQAVMLNSGLIAANPTHLPLVDDAILLIDRLWNAGLRRHDIEQFAIAETLRLGGVHIALIDDCFEHYCARWARRYMRRKLRHRQANTIPFSKTRVRLFKAYWTLRLAMRKARRFSTRGTSAKWRRT
jgi:hypothetical protein